MIMGPSISRALFFTYRKSGSVENASTLFAPFSSFKLIFY